MSKKKENLAELLEAIRFGSFRKVMESSEGVFLFTPKDFPKK